MPVMGERLYDPERQKHAKSEPPEYGGGETGFPLNYDQANAVNVISGLGGNAVAPRSVPPENTRKIRREYHENPMRIRRNLPISWLVGRMYLAWGSHEGGFGVALG